MLAFCALVLLLGIGCGGDADPSTSEASETATEAAPNGATDPLFDTDFAQVCRETGQPRAAAYVAGPGVHPVLVLKSRDGTEYHQDSATLPEGWAAAWPDLARAELVACVRQVTAKPVEVCEGYSDDDSGLKWTVETHDVVYDYTVRVAQTGAVLGSTTFEVPAGSCPMFSSYRTGDPLPVPYYPRVGDGAVELFLRPFVTGS